MEKSKEKNMKITRNWINVTKYFNKGIDNDKNIKKKMTTHKKTDWNHKETKICKKNHQRNQNQSQRDWERDTKMKRPERLKIFGHSCSVMFWAVLLLTMTFSIDYSASYFLT